MKVQHLTNDSGELEQWDQFLMSSPRGHYCQLSTYLNSFKVYGFSYHVIVIKNRGNDQIIGGIGLLEFGKQPLKLVAVPMGPIIDVGYEDSFSLLLSEALSYSKSVGAFLFQLKIPFTEEFCDPAILSRIRMPSHASHRYGFPFDLMTAPNQMLWIEYGKTTSQEEWQSKMFKQFNNNTKRNIRKSEKDGLSLLQVTKESELKQAYSLIELNGREQGYSTRSWDEFGRTLIEQVIRGQAIVLVACREGRFLGTHYGVLAGQRYSYMMGGTVRTEENYNVGHFIHWEAMKKAYALGLRGYDLTSGGSVGVMRFKMGFRPTHIRFDSPHYYILSRPWFYICMKIFPVLRKYRINIARYAKLLYRNKN